MDDVLVMTMSEFGRTSRENANRGTDHGHATTWFVVGRPITGGVYGTWPGLATNQLQDGRYLNHSVDYRNVMAEVMVRHLGEPNVGTVSQAGPTRRLGSCRSKLLSRTSRTVRDRN